MRRLIVFATLFEAEKVVSPSQKIAPDLYQTVYGDVLITGMGSIRAATLVSSHLQNYDEVINIGFAGSLDTSKSLGDILPIKQVVKYTTFLLEKPLWSLTHKAFPRLSLAQEGVNLMTFDFPLHDKKIAQQLASKWSLVDMEGYGIAMSAKYWDKPCRLYKIVSDFTNHETTLSIKEKQPILTQKIKDFLESLYTSLSR